MSGLPRLRKPFAAIVAVVALALTGTGCASVQTPGEATATVTQPAVHTDSVRPHSARHHGAQHRHHKARPHATARHRRKPAVSSGRRTALGVLATLTVKGRAPMTGYSRDAFGPAWDDNAGSFPWTGNGCDTRDDVLARDLTSKTLGPDGCTVESGTMTVEPYTGQADRHFVRGGAYADELDIDHVVALADAWQTGAQYWPLAKREAIANDPVNLLAVDPSLNREKGDADAASWLPPNKSYRCSYVARQVTVKAKYGLWVTAAEKAAMQRVLDTCPNQPLAAAVPKTAQPTQPAPSSSPVAASGGSGSGKCEPGYSPCLPVVADLNCSDIPANKKPVHVTGNDPYRLDANHDGLGCTS